MQPGRVGSPRLPARPAEAYDRGAPKNLPTTERLGLVARSRLDVSAPFWLSGHYAAAATRNLAACILVSPLASADPRRDSGADGASDRYLKAARSDRGIEPNAFLAAPSTFGENPAGKGKKMIPSAGRDDPALLAQAVAEMRWRGNVGVARHASEREDFGRRRPGKDCISP